jgi:ABC-type multidrug transport system fused ATPase/permease subunit
VKVAARHLDQQVFAWIPGKSHYTWEDFGQDLRGKLADGTEYTMPSPLKSVEMMLRDMLIFLVLTWYFDHIISANRGVGDPAYFVFTGKFWRSVFGIKEKRPEEQPNKKKKKKKSKISEEDLLAELGMANPANDGKPVDKMTSVRNEKKRVVNAERNGDISPGLRVIGLKKTYYKKPFGMKSKNDVHAVRGIWFEAADRELLALLGHNGAGKSTTFSMLTGVLQPSEGTAKICGLDI